LVFLFGQGGYHRFLCLRGGGRRPAPSAVGGGRRAAARRRPFCHLRRPPRGLAVEEAPDRPGRELLLHPLFPDEMGGLELTASGELLELPAGYRPLLLPVNFVVPVGGHGGLQEAKAFALRVSVFPRIKDGSEETSPQPSFALSR